MKIHRFIGDFDLTKNEVEITNPENIKQIKGVLRMKKGDVISLSDGKGTSAEVIIDSIFSDKIACIVNKKPHSAKASRGEYRKVSLYLSILKKENFELAVQKAVECGVSNITPVITERTIKTGLNIKRLEKIILEASEQCGQSMVPTLSPILKFQDALADGDKSDQKIIFHLGGIDFPTYGGNASVCIFIGPEGGFTDNEINLAEKSGYKVASLGPLVLRGETAAIVATYRAVQAI
ncbi:16S rRNA (uracil(1498)-N(3))-methyltransferase [Candidatus Nomurabacteria bacterium]|nr:16S rRNA (uracil(1498)-N(3))-methyltransferase [Candidatus Nomurabacteria bacterium]